MITGTQTLCPFDLVVFSGITDEVGSLQVSLTARNKANLFDFFEQGSIIEDATKLETTKWNKDRFERPDGSRSRCGSAPRFVSISWGRADNLEIHIPAMLGNQAKSEGNESLMV